MEGTVRSFLPTKGYGFVRGDDGNDYFLHEQDMPKGLAPHPGQRVTFEETATPKGYRARRVQPLLATPTGRYVVPGQIIETKGAEFPDWEILESIPWYIIGTSRASPDAARLDLRGRAREIGANAVTLVEYFKTTGSEAGTGRGTHHFTVHNFLAAPVVVGRATHSGGAERESLVRMAGKVGEISWQLERKRQIQHRWGFAFITVGAVMLGIGLFSPWFALRGITFLPGVVILALSFLFFRRVEPWLVPMGHFPKRG